MSLKINCTSWTNWCELFIVHFSTCASREVGGLLAPGLSLCQSHCSSGLLRLTTCELLLGFWTRGLTSLKTLSLETNEFNYVFKKCAVDLLCIEEDADLRECFIKGSVFSCICVHWKLLIPGRNKMEGKLARFLQPKVAFAFHSVLNDANGESLISFLYSSYLLSTLLKLHVWD